MISLTLNPGIGSGYGGDLRSGVKMRTLGARLVKRGVISLKMFREACEIQHSRRALISELAVELGMLNVEQVLEILCLQRDRAFYYFWACARDHDYLTADQVTQLLALRQRRTPSVIDILVELGHLPQDRAALEVNAYEAEWAAYEARQAACECD